MPKGGLTYKERVRAKLFEIQIGRPMTAPIITQITKSREKCRVALVTTGGLHLTSQEPFTTEKGDHTFRLIPRLTQPPDLTVTHGHYDETDVRADANCLLPMDRLEELVAEGYVASAAANHISFMGYIPDVGPLVKETAPEAARILLEDGVDIAVLTPGWYTCHQSVGLIQREMEERGIRTVSLMNLPNIGKIVRPPRILQVNYSLGTIFGHAGDVETQTKILKKAIDVALEGEPESLLVYDPSDKQFL